MWSINNNAFHSLFRKCSPRRDGTCTFLRLLILLLKMSTYGLYWPDVVGTRRNRFDKSMSVCTITFPQEHTLPQTYYASIIQPSLYQLSPYRSWIGAPCWLIFSAHWCIRTSYFCLCSRIPCSRISQRAWVHLQWSRIYWGAKICLILDEEAVAEIGWEMEGKGHIGYGKPDGDLVIRWFWRYPSI
jgi:hypothetical protein